MSATTELVSPEILDRVKGWRGYVEAKLGFRNHWYPTLKSSDVLEGKPKTFKLCGENLLLNRIDGKVYAMRDRCMHRGVPFSRQIECHKKGTITCWYHGWTFDWKSGDLVGILSNPMSSQIGKHAIKVYPVEEAKGLLFVFLGEAEGIPLINDVPPGFLDEDNEVGIEARALKSNWRVGVENGFDAGHIWIHRTAKIVDHGKLAFPVGFAPPEGAKTTDIDVDHGPLGIYDRLGEQSMPVFESYLGDEKVYEGAYGENRIAHEVSMWLPCALKVDPMPRAGVVHCEWYVPIDADNHWYVQTMGSRGDPVHRAAFREEFETVLRDMIFEDFNGCDMWAREAGNEFYSNDVGWVEERLYESDIAIVEWRKFASKYNRGIQRPVNFYS